ncbi:hypothetical protein QBC43DRAFT_305544 [Cladorrhinum sp. PSN259]|nr:hypothetical protein QBC43DRAFT_305544 [Cladorrhinum sp. PSN259]
MTLFSCVAQARALLSMLLYLPASNTQIVRKLTKSFVNLQILNSELLLIPGDRLLQKPHCSCIIRWGRTRPVDQIHG